MNQPKHNPLDPTFRERLRIFKQLAAVLIGLLCLYIFATWLQSQLPQQNFSLQNYAVHLVNQLNWINHSDSTVTSSILLFMLIAATTAVGLPRQIAAFIAGINLGAMIGVIVATLATTLGCWLTFLAARYLFSERVKKKYPSQLNKLSVFLGEQTFLKALVIRILPLGSNFITNIVAGVSDVSARKYVAGSCVGFIPQMVIFSLLGSGMKLADNTQLMMSGILLVVAVLLSVYMMKMHRKNKHKPKIIKPDFL